MSRQANAFVLFANEFSHLSFELMLLLFNVTALISTSFLACNTLLSMDLTFEQGGFLCLVAINFAESNIKKLCIICLHMLSNLYCEKLQQAAYD